MIMYGQVSILALICDLHKAEKSFR